MEQKDKKKRSKWFLAIPFVVIAAIIVLAVVFFDGNNSLKGEWDAKSEGFYADVAEDDKLTLKGSFGGTYVEVELVYAVNTIKKEFTMSQGETDAYKKALASAKNPISEDMLREAIEPYLASYDYKLENDTLTLTEQKTGDKIVFTRGNKIKLEITTSVGDVRSVCANDEEAIKTLHEIGFKNIDFSMYSLNWDSPFMQDNWKETALALKSEVDDLGMKFVQAHSPGTNPFDGDNKELAIATNKRAIEVCEVLGIKKLVVHPGFKEGLSKEQWFEENKAFYNELLPTAEKCGVDILCENSTARNMGTKYNINTGADMREFIEYVNHPNFHGCWDTGHANCEGSQYDDILALGDEMHAIHFHDNTGESDMHLLPYYGTLNVDEIMLALNMIEFKGYFTLEADGEMRTSRTNGSYTGPELEGIDDPYPIDRMEQEEILYKLTEYILKEHDMLEETK